MNKNKMTAFFNRVSWVVAYSDSDLTSHEWRKIPEEVLCIVEKINGGVPLFSTGNPDESKYKVIWSRNND